MIFTGRNEVVAKVMFLLVSVILSRGGVLSQHALQQVSGGGPAPGGVSLAEGGSPCWGGGGLYGLLVWWPSG